MAEITKSGSVAGRWFGTLANPAVFMRVSARLLPWLIVIAVISFFVGLYLSFASPPDYQQGETVRIMYVHVPSAWLAMACYVLIAASSAGLLVWRHPLADVAAQTAAPIGAVFNLLALVTGSLWGKPTWGTYWEWDGRLTSFLILFFLYLGLIALRRAIDEPGRAGRAAAILSLMGVVNVPIIKFSVDWWNTLHQPDSISLSGSSIDLSMLIPLFVMTFAFTTLFVVLHLKAMRAEILRRRCDALIAVHVRDGAATETAHA